MANSSGKPYKPYRKKKKTNIEEELPIPEKKVAKNIQWFPGHMAKAKRQIIEDLKTVDIAIELCDARIPWASRNPQIRSILGNKPSILLLNKSSLADPKKSELWRESFAARGENVLFTDCITGQGIKDIVPLVRSVLSDKLQRFEEKGMGGRLPRAMIIGVTNAGKSTLVNKLYGSRKMKAEDRPGVTRENRWITIENSIELLDTPGILWPKFDSEETGLRLAYTGAIRDEILDREEIAVQLCGTLQEMYPELLYERYKLTEDISLLQPWELFELIGRKRGFLVSGGEVDYARCAVMLLDEFRGGRIGRITLEVPMKRQSRKTDGDTDDAE